MEWEHIVPAQAFGQSFKEWPEAYPDCVDRKGKPFRNINCSRQRNIRLGYIESDLYNLVPGICEINGLRSNYRFAIIPEEKGKFGFCDMEIEERKPEPWPEVREEYCLNLILGELAVSRTWDHF